MNPDFDYLLKEEIFFLENLKDSSFNLNQTNSEIQSNRYLLGFKQLHLSNSKVEFNSNYFLQTQTSTGI